MATSDRVTEALLEMHYAHAIANLFAGTFGKRYLRFWKPSQNEEAYLGFDQGWVRHTGKADAFESALKSSISNGTQHVPSSFVGYFMQFKRVEHMRKRSKFKASSIVPGYYRAAIDLIPSPTTGLSQHQTLTRLAQIHGTDVSYACGMIFDADAIYDEPNLDSLRVAPVDAAVISGSATWKSSERHFIQFQTATSDPIWCSTPFDGKSLALRDWAQKQRLRGIQEMVALVREVRAVLRLDNNKMLPFLRILQFQ